MCVCVFRLFCCLAFSRLISLVRVLSCIDADVSAALLPWLVCCVSAIRCPGFRSSFPVTNSQDCVHSLGANVPQKYSNRAVLYFVLIEFFSRLFLPFECLLADTLLVPHAFVREKRKKKAKETTFPRPRSLLHSVLIFIRSPQTTTTTTKCFHSKLALRSAAPQHSATPWRCCRSPRKQHPKMLLQRYRQRRWPPPPKRGVAVTLPEC